MSESNAAQVSRTERIINSGWTLFVAILFIGPLALPLLWRNPTFSKKSKSVWSAVIVLLTLLSLWVLKFAAVALSNATAAEPCRFDRHRLAYPPGQKVVRVHAGAEKNFEKFSDPKELFQYLKQANGKKCDVNWKQAKAEMQDWLSSGWNSIESLVGPELDVLIENQNSGKSTEARIESASTPAKSPASDCSGKIARLRERVSSLKDQVYDSRQTRSAEIESILRSIEHCGDPGPLL